MFTSSLSGRRDWFKATGASLAGLALAQGLLRPGAAWAQHEADRSAARTEPVKLNGNENPFGPSQHAIMAMMQALEGTHYYGMDATAKLMTALAAKEGVKESQIVTGSGSGEVLERIADWMAETPGEVITATPGYLKFTNAAGAGGLKIVSVPLDPDLRHDLDAMAAKVGPNTRCVYICNPNNPTSTVVDAAALKAFVLAVSKTCTVLVDEAYLECSDTFAANTMAGLVRDGHNVVVARTFSKIYGLAGQRIGYAIMPEAIAQPVLASGAGRANTAFRLNSLGVIAATASLEDAAYVEETRLKIKAGRDELLAVLKQLGRRYAEPQGNFVFFHTGMPITLFAEKMAKENVLVGRAFPPLLDWCRLSVGTPDEMALAHAGLRKVFSA